MFKTRNKVFSVVCSAALFTGILAGCSGSKESTSNGSDSKETTLTLLMDNQSPATMDGFKAVAAEFEKKYHVKTEIETRPGGSEGDNLVKTRLSTGDMTDLMAYNSGSLLQALNPEKNFVDLTDEPYMDTILDTFKTAVTVDKKVYGIPVGGFSAGGWLYNKKVYQELGLSVPKTWDELMENNEKIKAAGKTAVIGTYKDTWTSQVIMLADNYNLLAEDPSFPDDFTANKAKMATTPAALKSFEKLADIYKKGYMNKDFNSTGYDAGLKMLVDGTGVQYPMISFALANIATLYPDQIDNIGFFPQPGDSADKNGITAWAPGAIYINKASEHVSEAKKWAEFFVTPEAVKLFMLKSTPTGPAAIKDAQLPDNVYAAVKDMIPYFNDGKTAPALEFLSPLKGPNLPQITSQVGGGMVSAKEGAKSYDQDVEKQAKQLGLKGW
ncbi:ABC transporter substrate-binding protein [Bacillus sp. AFS076308]|uniref:ABC transporter substrate-binding protein n=1 Tax=unclassified Bacillus (in: firmicutes) TaxID=185979 RepID=UPI000BF85243|nr:MULTISPECIES: ABC transporter substrate-binding protein [unclassified Bacillus (in: firmicutes)]PFO06364.1 ABC transporter substrate-binding protein [Bacillus sp. AFS076308]PGV49394.1 ABC transporter substrate-binding protein [Bacillus sp. AFS037270]